MTALLAFAAGLLAAFAGLVAQLALVVVVYATDLFSSPVVGDTVSWGLLAGVFTPLLTSVVQRRNWSKRSRALVGAGVSIVIGLLTCLANGDLSKGQTVLATIAVVLVAAHATYSQLWKPTGVAPAIQDATSPGSTDGGDARHAS